MFRRIEIVSIIIFLNVVVFLFWNFSSQEDDSFMAKNFLVSWDALIEGRIWTLFTSVFSHIAFFHIFLNMFVLRSFGSVIEYVLGRKLFLLFYLIAGIISSLSHSLVSLFFLDQPELPALGASGAVSGIVLLFSLMFPREKILLLGFIPMPALLGAILFIGIDLWGVLLQSWGGGFPIGHGAHLGGAFTGLFYYFFLILPRRKT